jgi:hypothetical protein
MNCKKTLKSLQDYIDGHSTPAVAQQIEDHIETCASCRRETLTLRMICETARSSEPISTPESLWQSIEAELDAPAPQPFSWRRRLTEWWSSVEFALPIPVPVVRLTGLASLLLVGILLGRYLFPAAPLEQPEMIARTDAVDDIHIVQARANRYIEKSKVLFLGIANAEQTLDLDWERKMARSLVQEASFLKESLPARDLRMRQLVEELEMILFEIANLEQKRDLQNVEMIKSGIDRRGILLQIYLHDLTLPEVKSRGSEST